MGATVELQGLQAAIQAAQAAALAELRERLADGAGDVLAGAQAAWPVKSGRSRDGLGLTATRARHGIDIEIGGAVEYTDDIVQRRLGGRRPWSALVVVPTERLRERLRESLARHLEQAIARVLR